ncbi:MAG: hypothetical protein V2B20_15290 [Pseudomonadota bacterium]
MADEQSTRSLLTKAVVRLFDIENPQYLFLLIGIAILGGLGYGLFKPDGTFLDALRNAETSRALITFLVTVTTVSIAILASLYAISSNQSREEIKERFGLAKEVLAILVGILGTVLGFYYGTADKTAGTQVQLADIQLRGSELMTHVSGGVAPYRYAVSYPSLGTTGKLSGISKDGWIIQTLSPAPTKNDSFTVDVTDAKEQRASKASPAPEVNPEAPVQVRQAPLEQPKTQPPTQQGQVPPTPAPAASK